LEAFPGFAMATLVLAKKALCVCVCECVCARARSLPRASQGSVRARRGESRARS